MIDFESWAHRLFYFFVFPFFFVCILLCRLSLFVGPIRQSFRFDSFFGFVVFSCRSFRCGCSFFCFNTKLDLQYRMPTNQILNISNWEIFRFSILAANSPPLSALRSSRILMIYHTFHEFNETKYEIWQYQLNRSRCCSIHFFFYFILFHNSKEWPGGDVDNIIYIGRYVCLQCVYGPDFVAGKTSRPFSDDTKRVFPKGQSEC